MTLVMAKIQRFIGLHLPSINIELRLFFVSHIEQHIAGITRNYLDSIFLILGLFMINK